MLWAMGWRYPTLAAGHTTWWMRAGFAPRAPYCFTSVTAFMRAGSTPRGYPSRSPQGACDAPKPPATDACRTINAPAYAPGMPRLGSSTACSDLPVSMRIRRSTCCSTESRFERAAPFAGGTGVAAHPCRPPRRRSTNQVICRLRHNTSERAPQRSPKRLSRSKRSSRRCNAIRC
jgi:hypothetical protein